VGETWKAGERCSLVLLNKRDPGPHAGTVERVDETHTDVLLDDGRRFRVGLASSFLQRPSEVKRPRS